MTNRTTIKLSLALAGIALFGAGIRWDNQTLRWAGTAVVAVAALLRFWKGRTPRGGA
ncbi:MAG: hypothetical protein ACYC3L_05485 [Gemmatimonadaceae bacterium]